MATQAASGATGPSIAACVRKVTFETAQEHFRSANDGFFQLRYGDRRIGSNKRCRSLERKAIKNYTVYRSLSANASSTMPNLEALIWVDMFPLDRAFFGKFIHSKAKHVRLNRVAMNEPPWPVEPPLTPSTWPIRSLDLDITVLGDDYLALEQADPEQVNIDDQMSRFFTGLLRLCSPTLESLRWGYRPFRLVSLGAVSFPRLRQLQLEGVQLDDAGISSFFSCPLRSLYLQPADATNPALFGVHRRYLRDLEAFAIPCLSVDGERCQEVAQFIIRHSHLEKLLLHEIQTHSDNAHLDRHIMPALASHSFSNLRSLSLSWAGYSLERSDFPRGVRISQQALLTIGNLVSLEQLYLCASSVWDHRSRWAVDHAELITSLGNLKKLRMLALVGDIYPVPGGVGNPEDYYLASVATAAETNDAELRPELDDPEELNQRDLDDVSFQRFLRRRQWNRAHRNRMLAHAEEYAVLLPELEWMLCGRWPIGFEQDPENPAAPRKAVPLSLEMDSCKTFLDATFGCGITKA